MTDRTDRRRNHALRQRIDELLGRVRDARSHIVERGLDAVQTPAGSGERDGTGQPERAVDRDDLRRGGPAT